MTVFLEQKTTVTEWGIDLLYWLIGAVLLVLWVQLLLKKRAPEKSVMIMFGTVFLMAMLSGIVILCRPPINWNAVIEKAILTVAFLIFTVTEWICYRKNNQ